MAGHAAKSRRISAADAAVPRRHRRRRPLPPSGRERLAAGPAADSMCGTEVKAAPALRVRWLQGCRWRRCLPLHMWLLEMLQLLAGRRRRIKLCRRRRRLQQLLPRLSLVLLLCLQLLLMHVGQQLLRVRLRLMLLKPSLQGLCTRQTICL